MNFNRSKKNKTADRKIVLRFSRLNFNLAILFLSMLATELTYSMPMEFHTYFGTPDCLKCVIVAADGDIAESTPEIFEKLIESYSTTSPQDTTIVLNSPGGSLLGGLRFGEIIRRNSFNTHIGVIKSNTNSGYLMHEGMCASACAYAYLGGMRRSMSPESKYGLHQISIGSNAALPINQTVRMTQEIIAEISNYVERMGASTEIVTIATRTSNISVDWIEASDQYTLGIVNSNALVQQQPWKRGPTIRNWSVVAVLPDASKDMFIMSCESGPSSFSAPGDVRLILTQSKQLESSHPYFGELINIPVTILMNGEAIQPSSSQPFYFGGPGHSMYSLAIPFSTVRQALQTHGNLSIKISYPTSFPPSFSVYEHPIPLNGLNQVVEAFEMSCSHLQ